MSTLTAPAYTNEPIFRLTVEQYHELIRSGKLTENDPVELIEGILVFKMPKNTAHATVVRLCRRVIEPQLPPSSFYDSEQPITLDDGEPEPDGMIVRGAIEEFANAHPGPSDIALLIEVADTSLERDRGMKLRSYARAGIEHYWIVNLVDRHLEIYSDPGEEAQSNPAYRYREVLADGEIRMILDGFQLQVALKSILPPPSGQSSR